jgi:hypothetical protein
VSYWHVIEPYWETVSIYDGPEVFLDQFAKMPRQAQVLFAAHWTQSEVRNGGLSQFFGNCTGVLAPEAVEAFRALGMPEAAQTLQQALAFFGDVYPRERAPREDALEAYFDNLDSQGVDGPDPFEELDDQFSDFLDDEVKGFEASASAFSSKVA